MASVSATSTTDLSKIRKDYLKLNKAKLIKKCKAQKLDAYGTKTEMVDLLIKKLSAKKTKQIRSPNKSQTLSPKTSKSIKLKESIKDHQNSFKMSKALNSKQQNKKLKRDNHKKIGIKSKAVSMDKSSAKHKGINNIKSAEEILEDKNEKINTKSTASIYSLDGNDTDSLNIILNEIEDKYPINDGLKKLKKRMIDITNNAKLAINEANIMQQQLKQKINDLKLRVLWEWKTTQNEWISYDEELCEIIEQLNNGESHTFFNHNDNKQYIITKKSKQNAVQSMESVGGMMLLWQCRRTEKCKHEQRAMDAEKRLNENKKILESLKQEIDGKNCKIQSLQNMTGNTGIHVIWQWKSANNKWESYGDEISEEIDALDINQRYEYSNRNVIIKNTINTATHIFKLRFGESRTECRRIEQNVLLLEEFNDIKQKLTNHNDEMKRMQEEYLCEKKRLLDGINKMKEELVNKEDERKGLEQEMEDKSNELLVQTAKIEELEKRLSHQMDEERKKMKKKGEEIRKIRKLRRELYNEMKNEMEQEMIKLKGKDDEIKRLKEQLNKEQDTLSSSLEQLSEIITNQKVEIDDLNKKNDLYFDKLIDIEKQRDEQMTKIKEKDGIIVCYIAEVQELKQKLKNLESALSEKDKIMKDQEAEISRLNDGRMSKMKIKRISVDKNACPVMKEAINAFNRCFSDIPREFIDTSHNKCYCNDCHKASNEELIYFRGEPAKKYVLPVGWTRMGINVDQGKCKMNNVWDDWHVAFHGTDKQSLKEVFKSGLQLLKPGDMTINGNALSMKPGHIENTFYRYNHYTKKNELFDPNQIFMSPSMKYSSNTIYAKKYDLGNGDKVQFVLQLRIRANSYNIGHETIGATTDGVIIDNNYNNNELEWYTKENVGIIIHGLLIKVEKKNYK